jgi:hypothetical protein
MIGRRVAYPLIISCVAAILLGLLFTVVVYCQRPSEELWGWLIQLIATLIGATLAVAGGVYLLTYQSLKADEDKSNQLLTTLAGELQSSLEILNSDDRTAITTREGNEIGSVILIRLIPVAAEETIRSGVFDATDAHLLSNLVRQMWAHNDDVALLSSQRLASSTREQLVTVTADLNQRQQEVNRLCIDFLRVLKSIDIELPDASIPFLEGGEEN